MPMVQVSLKVALAAGLRAFFEYRDLGIKAATDGKYVAHVIRAVPGVMLSRNGTHMTLIFR